ncbi:unnamed protein product [Fraxinus pennsylvanica]|uniref:Homeobox-leucine zipper protein n=1 Tax=Fraxinus pennsylvanica TaxID=56036 RepID=A0AAD2DTI4_9LAMI|nr:unnamed protein product [Fraxinus pennsylvanica]
MEFSSIFFDPSYSGSMFPGKGDSIFQGAKSVMNMEETAKKRPFFSTPEELYDEEYFDQKLPEKKRRLTLEQVNLLEKSFEAEKRLEPERKTQLAKNLGLQPQQVAVWFQNRRARWRNKQLERDHDHLKSSYECLLSNYDSILKENEQLKAEVLSMTEKLGPKELAGEPVYYQISDTLPVVASPAPSLQISVKVEDRLSTGSDGSAVVDEGCPHLVDSGNSYFPENEYPGYVAAIDCVHSEEDYGSDDIGNYFSASVGAEQEQHEDVEALGWFICCNGSHGVWGNKKMKNRVLGRSLRRGFSERNADVVERGSFGSTSMSQDDIEKLPRFNFKTKERGSSPAAICTVCLENFKVGEKCRLLPLCNHSFHADCVDLWLLRTPICPICRTCADFVKSESILGEESNHFSETESGIEVGMNQRMEMIHLGEDDAQGRQATETGNSSETTIDSRESQESETTASNSSETVIDLSENQETETDDNSSEIVIISRDS